MRLSLLNPLRPDSPPGVGWRGRATENRRTFATRPDGTEPHIRAKERRGSPAALVAEKGASLDTESLHRKCAKTKQDCSHEEKYRGSSGLGEIEPSDDFKKSLLNFRRYCDDESQLLGHGLEFRPPFRRHDERGWKRMRCPFCEYATGGGGGGRIVQLTECIDQENVENVSGPACCCRTGTSVESGECDTLRETTMTCSRP